MRFGTPWIICAALAPAASFAQGGEAPPAAEQAPQETERVSLRVSQLRPAGVVIVDRGSDDGLAVGDRVVFYPPGSGAQSGRVRVLDARSAEVQLDDRRTRLLAGTRGFAQVPAARFAAPGAAAEAAPEVVEHPPWENEDVEFEETMPLLTSIDGVRPEDRLPLVSGRLYSIGNVRETNDNGRSDHFVRLGTELHFENPFGEGGQVHFEGEVNNRATYVQDQVDEGVTRGRLDRLSYEWGGTRFQPNRHEAGRFLHYGVPELGILDGYEWNRRLEDGHRAGLSVGFLPEPTPTMSTGDDLAISGFYQWAADERERLTATGAFQKTWHDASADRDLFIFKLDYWESEGWDFHGTAWLDWYTANDLGKAAGPELTRVFASTTRTWESGDGLTFTFIHNAFPSLERFEYWPVDENQLNEDHNERLSADGWTWVGPKTRLHGRVGAWVDQEDGGGDAEAGVEQLDVFLEDSRADVTVFSSLGKFSTNHGLRARYGIQRAQMHWDASYEYFQSDQLGFSADNDNLDHHRMLGSVDYSGLSGWSFSLSGGLEFWSDRTAAVAGFYLQRSF